MKTVLKTKNAIGRSCFYRRFLPVSFLLSLLFSLQSVAQSYTYEPESFEGAEWATASNTSNPIVSSTGIWTTAKSNIQTNAYAQDGVYSLIIATKTNALISPKLDYGVGVLTYHANKPAGGGRTITISTSVDKVTWSAPIESFSVPGEWTERKVVINDPDVRYISFSTNSNGGVYIDNVKMTSAGAKGITVTSTDVTDITQTTALAGGTIVSDGSATISNYGICYNTTGMPDVFSNNVEFAGTTGNFTALIEGLTPGTTYYFKAYATTTFGVNYGEEVMFTTRSSDAPLAYWMQPFDDTSQFPGTNPSSDLEITVPGQGTWIYKGAYKGSNPSYIRDGSPYNLRLVKNGSYVITPVLEDGVTDVSFDEGRGDRELTIYTSTNGGTAWTLLKTVKTVKDASNVISVNSSTANRIKIANESGGDADIDNITVTVFPSGTVPTVKTSIVTNIAKNTALSGGEVTSEGTKTVVERGVCWSLEAVPLIADHATINGSGSGSFSSELSGLPAGKKIYLRAYARSRAGTGYGEIVTFTTEPATIPVITTVAASDITGETAISGGTIIDGGGAPVTERGVCWNTGGNPTMQDNKTTDNDDFDTFQSILTNLTPETRYYYRAYAVNEAGVGYGNIETLTTGSVRLPAVTTSDVTSVLSYKATGSGTITDNGNAPTISGLCWNETGMPTIDDLKTSGENALGAFTNVMGNLKSAAVYYVRAYATNSVGTVYGNEISFTTASSTVYYAAPDGNDLTGDGSFEKPFFSVQKAIDLVTPGDTIYMKGGTYHYSVRINADKIGEAAGGTICLFAEKGKRALLDFSAMPLDGSNQGIRVSGSYWHFYGLDIKGAGDNGMLIERNKPSGGTYVDVKDRTDEAHHNIVEFCSFFENKDTGLQLKNLAENNRIINCDSYYNRDPEDGNADGFAPKLTVGTGNYFYGCRAWNNSDDGWDGILAETSAGGFPDDMLTVMENCWAFNNGFWKDGKETKGNGNGFKLGGSGTYDKRHNVIMKRCLAFNNLMKGFDQNHNVGSMTLINCTGYSSKYLANKNHYTYKIDGTVLAPGKKLTLINSVAVCDGLDADKSAYAPCQLVGGERITCDFMTSASDYVTVDTTGVFGPRKADGSLPDVNFMQIKPGNSKLIDTGTITEGIFFNGSKPDLGCFEAAAATDIDEVYDSGDKSMNGISIYPQPVTTRFTVEIPGVSSENKCSLRIVDLSGKEIYRKPFTGNTTTVERGNLKSGLYIVHISEESGQKFSSKLIVR